MSNLVALTNIRHGAEDGTLVEVLYGQSVDVLPDEIVASLLEANLVGPATEQVEAETAEVDAQVKEDEDEDEPKE